MRRILMVCHGNICRSAMAQSVLQALAAREHSAGRIEVDSAGVSGEEHGRGMYPAARAKLEQKGVPIAEHRARMIARADLDAFDEIYYMDHYNRHMLDRMFPHYKDRFEPLLPNRDIADPWYSGDFETAFQDILEGCRRILKESGREIQ